MHTVKNKVLDGSLKVVQISRTLDSSGVRKRFVRVNEDRLREFASHFDRSKLAHWTSSSPVKFSDLPEEERLAFLFVFNALSFSYYANPGKPKWKVEYGGEVLERGTWSMLAALKKGVGTSLDLDSDALRILSRSRFEEILKGADKIDIPLLEERFRILKELAEIISPHRFRAVFVQTSMEIIETVGRVDALSIVDYIISKIPSFKDTATYEEVEVPFNKRAQLLVSDIHALMSGFNGIYSFSGVDDLTACADYILPIVLRHFGILEYSPELAAMVDQRVPILSGSPEEVEIRANTIVAVHALSQLLGIPQMRINDYLWNLGSEIPEECEHHLVTPRTTAY